VAQVVESLPRKREDLTSSSSTTFLKSYKKRRVESAESTFTIWAFTQKHLASAQVVHALHGLFTGNS
jgi:hypothetical protein